MIDIAVVRADQRRSASPACFSKRSVGYFASSGRKRAAFNGEEGQFVADRLRRFINRAGHLLEGDIAKSIARPKLVLGAALSTVGDLSAWQVFFGAAPNKVSGATIGAKTEWRQSHT